MENIYDWAFLVAQMVKNPSAVHEMWAWSLDQEVSLEKEMATHPTIFPWKIPWAEEPGRLQSMGSEGVRHDLVTKQQQQQQSLQSHF